MKQKIKKPSFFYSKVVDIYQQVGELLKKDPTIGLLFIIIAVVDMLALMILFLSHSEPFSIILAPIIRAFYSDRFLHYPTNFYILPRLFSWAHFATTTVLGILITGVVVKKIQSQYIDGGIESIRGASKSVFSRYFSILAAWLISYVLFRVVFKYVIPPFAQSLLGYLVSSYVTSLVLQGYLMFLIPIILIKNTNVLVALGESFKVMLLNIIPVAMILSIPMLFVVALSYLNFLTPVFLKLYPEMVLIVLAVGIVVLTAVDLVITSTATVLYLKVRNEKQ